MDYGKLLSQRRDEWTLDALLKRESVESSSDIRDLYERWKQGIQLTPADHVVVADGDDPMNWMIPDHQDRLAPNWATKRMRDYPIKLHGIPCAIEYKICLDSGQPLCHMIKQSFKDLKRQYLRILLPMSGKIVYTFRPLIKPQLPGWARRGMAGLSSANQRQA